MPIVARPRILVALLALPLANLAHADEPTPKPKPTVETVNNTVKLDLQISGVEQGWKVEIKPANPGSRFKPVVRQVEQSQGNPAQLGQIAIDARSLSADRDCALAIVLTDPEGASQTFKRSIRLLPQPDADTVPELSKTFYLRSSSVAIRDTPRRRPN
ncbi:hypothetical protein [Tautonia marina]|uniref:hypothetical protein n=1 Tax=Tautonia marina TaxID=2653855 RepID=UPI0012607962|nr:hypothetical protein [Tautonia marina]